VATVIPTETKPELRRAGNADFRANAAETVPGQLRRSAINYAAYVGMDVHKDTIAVAVA